MVIGRFPLLTSIVTTRDHSSYRLVLRVYFTKIITHYPPLPEHTCTLALSENCICNVLSKYKRASTKISFYFTKLNYMYTLKIALSSHYNYSHIFTCWYFSFKRRYKNLIKVTLWLLA